MVEEQQTSAATTTCTRRPPTFLTLPYEIRLQIYEALLLYPPPSSPSPWSTASSPPSPLSLFCPRILLACRQTHAEGRPVLYSRNTFLAHASLLTSFPSLTGAHPPLREPAVLPLIRRWRLRLDCDPPWTGPPPSCRPPSRAPSSSSSRACADVRDPRVTGSLTGFEAYARWLEGVMREGPGREVGEFDESCETSGLVPMHAGGSMA